MVASDYAAPTRVAPVETRVASLVFTGATGTAEQDHEQVIADVFVIGVLASLDAGLLAASVVLLSRPRPAHKLAAFLIGCMGFSIGFGLVILFALHGSQLARPTDPPSKTDPNSAKNTHPHPLTFIGRPDRK